MKKILFVVALLIAGGCAQTEPTRYQIFGINKFRQIKANPKRHAGELYAFGGRAANVEHTQDGVRFELLVQSRLAGTGERLPADDPLTVVYRGGDTTVADGHQLLQTARPAL